MDNTAPVITEARPQPQQFADSQSHADQTSFYTRYFGNRVVNTLCTIASAAALYLMPIAGLVVSTIVVIKLIYDRNVRVVPQNEVQPIVSLANDDVRAADSGPLETTSGSRCVIIPQTGPTPSFTPEAEATLAAQTDGKPCPPLTSEEGLPSTQILKSPVLDSKPALAAELEPHEPKTRRQTPDTAISETASQHSLTVDTDNPIKTAIESINNQTTDRSTSPLPELRTSQPLAHSTPSTSPEGALATLSDTEPTGRELVPASSTSASSLNGQSNDFKAFYFTVDVTFSGKNVQVGFKPVDGSQFQSQSGTIATLSMLPESQNALMPGQSNELLTGLTPLELAFKDANGMPSKAEPFVFWVSRDWIRKHMNAGQNGAFLTFNRKQFNNHQLSQLLKPAIENGHQHPMINGATVNGVAPLQRSLKAVDIESSKLAAPEFVLESHDSTSFGEHSTESSPKTLSTPQIVEDKPVDRSLPPVSMVKELCNSSSEPTTDDESDDDTDSISSTASNSEELFYGDSDIDDVLGSSSEDNWSSSEESTEAQVNDEVSSPSSAVAAINKEQTGQLSVAVITSDIQLPAHLKNRKDQKKPKALEQATPLTAPATKEKIDTTFEKLFCFFLGLSDKKKNPSWENTNPYKDKETKTKLKTRYLDRFFTIDQVFGQACDPVNLIRCLMEPFDTMDPNIRWGVMARAVELDDFGALIKGNVEKGKLTPADIPAEKQRELLWTATMEAYLKFLERCQNEYSSTRKVKRTKALPKSINFDHIVLLAKLNCDIEKCSKQLQSFTTLTAEQLTEQKQSSLRALRTKVLELQAKAKEALTMLDALGVDKKLVSNILNPCSDKAEDDCSSKERESHTLHKLLKRIDKKLENFSSETIEEHQNSSAPMIMSDAQTTEVSKAGLLSQEAPPLLDSHNLVEGVSEPTPDKQTRSSDESSSSSEEESDEPSDLPVSGTVSHTAATPTISPADSDFSSEAEIKTIYDHIIPFCLKLHRGKTTNWQGVHPYGEENSTTYMNPKYTKRMLNEVAFGAGAEFINFVNTVNTQIVNIQDERRVKGLLNLIEHPIVEGKINLKGTEIRDKMLEVTKKHCLNFFEAAAKQYSEKNKTENKRKNTPHYTFDLLLPLQKFNYEFSLLVRDVNIINHSTLTIEEKMEMLLDLHVRAHELQSRQEQLYKRCLEKNIPLNKISFIFGGLDSDKKPTRIAEFQERISKTLQKTMDHAHETLEPNHPFWAFVDNIENTTRDIPSLAARAFDKWDMHYDSLSVQGITHSGTFEAIKSCESASILMEVPHEEVSEQVKMDLKREGYRLLLSSSDGKSTELSHQTFLDKRGEHAGSEQAAADAALDEITRGIDETLLKTDALTESTRLKFKSMIMRNSHQDGLVFHTQLSKIVTDHICKSLPMDNCVIQADSASRTSSSHFTLKDNKKTLTMVREMEWDLRLYQKMEDGDLDQVTLPHQKRIRIETSHELDLTKDTATCSPEEIVSFTGLKISDVPAKA